MSKSVILAKERAWRPDHVQFSYKSVSAAVVAALIAAFAGSSSTDVVIRETEHIRADTAAMRSSTDETRRHTRDLNDAFEVRARQSYQRGSAAADEAWDRFMGDRRG